jgi:ABC-2 type transport system permease protein
VKGLSWQRLRALLRKESLQIVRDPSSIGIAFVLPLVLLLLFGYGVSLDARGVPIALVVENPTPDAASFAGAFAESPWFTPYLLTDYPAAETALLNGDVQGIVRLRPDFARRLHDPDGAPIQVLVNGVDANTARLVQGYLQGVWQTWLTQRLTQRGHELKAPVLLEQRVWFNPEVRSRNFLVPGLIAIIMTLIGALLTAMVVAREWERGTMEALMATPVTVAEILLGKLLPYFVLGMGGLGLALAMAVWQFQVPLLGSLWLLLACSALFLLLALAMGLLFSTIARNQFTAAEIALIATFLPAFILSGFVFDIGSMPPAVQLFTYLVGARYFVAILHTLFLAGDLWSVILPNLLGLGLLTAVFVGVTRRLTRKRLE